MILKALYDLAQREKLVPDPDFEIKPVSWVIRVGDNGHFLGIEPLKQAENLPEGSKKKPKMLGIPMFVPYQGARTFGDRAFFLVDKSEYALGIDPKGEREADKLSCRLEMFYGQIELCKKATRHPAAHAIALFLSSLLNKEQAVLLPEACLTNDLFAFSYSLDDCRVHELEEIKQYWQGVCSKANKDEGKGKICLITGRKSLIADKIPLLKNVPGGSTSGVSLVSYNSSAFESYGWKEKTNSPVANATISSDGALLSMTALNRLLHPNPPDPQDPNQTLSKQNVHLSSDTVVCYWTRNKSALSDSFGLAIEVDEEKVEAKPAQVAEMYKSLWKGIPYKLDKPDEFYSLVLSGGQGRATVRDWIESNTQHVVDSLAQYFADLRIVRCCPAPKKIG